MHGEGSIRDGRVRLVAGVSVYSLLRHTCCYHSSCLLEVRDPTGTCACVHEPYGLAWGPKQEAQHLLSAGNVAWNLTVHSTQLVVVVEDLLGSVARAVDVSL